MNTTEPYFAAGKTNACKAVRCDRRRCDDSNGGKHRYETTVFKKGRKRNSAEAFPAIRIVFKNKRIRNKACCRCEDCVRFFERTAQHPDQRITHRKSQQRHKNIVSGLGEYLFCFD